MFVGVEKDFSFYVLVYFYVTPENVHIIKAIILYYDISTTII